MSCRKTLLVPQSVVQIISTRGGIKYSLERFQDFRGKGKWGLRGCDTVELMVKDQAIVNVVATRPITALALADKLIPDVYVFLFLLSAVTSRFTQLR